MAHPPSPHRSMYMIQFVACAIAVADEAFGDLVGHPPTEASREKMRGLIKDHRLTPQESEVYQLW